MQPLAAAIPSESGCPTPLYEGVIRLLFLASGPIKVYVIPEVEEIRDTSNRMVREGSPLYIAQFQQGGAVPEWAKKMAMERLSFGGLPDGYDPMHQIGWYDTDYEASINSWPAGIKEQVEAKLSAHQDQTYFLAERPKATPPWPNYPKLVVKGARTIAKVVAAILARVEEDGYDPQVVADYERDHENRTEVLAALDGLAAGAAEPEETVIAA